MANTFNFKTRLDLEISLARINEFITNTIANGIQEDVCVLQNGIVLLANMVGKKLTFVMYDSNMSFDIPFTGDSSSVIDDVQWRYKEWYILVIKNCAVDGKSFCLPGEHKMLYSRKRDGYTDGSISFDAVDDKSIIAYYQEKEGEKKYWL